MPPGCVAVVPPALHGAYRILLNGQEVHAAGSAPIDLRASLHGENNSLVIIARKDDPLISHAGTLVWRPYRLDISKMMKAGSNEIKILVTNTEANQRAVGTSRHILAAIDAYGMEGPVRIIPYTDQVITLHPVQDASNAKSARLTR